MSKVAKVAGALGRTRLLERVAASSVLSLLIGLTLHCGSRLGEETKRSRDEHFFPAWASSAPYNTPLLVRDTDSALGRLNEQPKELRLKDLARVHGHLCDGLVISWVGLRAALEQLFPDGVVDRTDLRTVSKNGPCWVDAAGWMTGARVNHGTLVLDNAMGTGFIVQRISDGRTVQVSPRGGVFPRQLDSLERSIRARRAAGQLVSPEEIDRFERMAEALIFTFLNTPAEILVEVEPVADYAFPDHSPDPIARRSDIVNREIRRRSSSGRQAR